MKATVVIAAVLAVGCGASMLDVQTGIAQSALELQVESEPLIRRTRVDEMKAAVERVHAEGGSEEEAVIASAHVSQRWACAIDSHRAYGAAVATYIDALLLSEREGGIQLVDFATFVQPIVVAYKALATCLTSLEVNLPVPAFLDVIAAQ